MRTDIKASLRFKWRAPWGGARPAESLKSYARRLANSADRKDAVLAQTWLSRKGCSWRCAELEPVRSVCPIAIVKVPARPNGEPPKRSDIEKAWRARPC